MKGSANVLATALFLAAALRADTTETRYFSAALSPANETHAVTGAAASGQATMTLFLRRSDAGAILSGTVYFHVHYNFGSAVTVTGLHIHQGGAGVDGPIRIDSGITDTNTVAAQGEGNLFRAVEVSGGAELMVLSGILAGPAGFYVNLHTSANTGGLMRDQLKVAEQPVPLCNKCGKPLDVRGRCRSCGASPTKGPAKPPQRPGQKPGQAPARAPAAAGTPKPRQAAPRTLAAKDPDFGMFDDEAAVAKQRASRASKTVPPPVPQGKANRKPTPKPKSPSPEEVGEDEFWELVE